MPYKPDLKYYDPVDLGGKTFYVCKACRDGRPREPFNCKAHDETQVHQEAISRFENPPQDHDNRENPWKSSPRIPTHDLLTEDALRALVVSLSAQPHQPPYPSDHPLVYGEPNFRTSPGPSPVTGVNWTLYETFEDTVADQSFEVQLTQDIAQATLDFLNGEDSDFEACEPSDIQSSSKSSIDGDKDSSVDDLTDAGPPRKRVRTNKNDPSTSREWYPWPDRITCSLDILMHLPRSVFSRKQLDLFLWLLRINNVDQVPSTKSMQTMNKMLQNMCGIETIPFNGKLGHKYHINSLAQILAQEMCNPKVRPFVHFYPEDTGPNISEARQGSRWLKELRPEETTLMVRIHGDDYFIYEPTMLNNLSFCIPTRWFARNGVFFARAWILEPSTLGDDSGWVVREDLDVEVSQDQLLKNFPQLGEDHERYQVPHPSVILGVHPKEPDDTNGLLRWTYTNPVLGNRWRALAKGHRTLALPLWLYCDDTSGNTSKKWNEHNSFLFTLAGLPREHAAKEYNVHFLCTSNLAPPLEMMDGVVSQIESAQRDGIWAWDCVHKELVLIFPTVLALLGDNPMHSEFACHIGLRGKYFCRTCWVKGTDVQDGTNLGNIRDDNTPENSPAPSAPSAPASEENFGNVPPTLPQQSALEIPLSSSMSESVAPSTANVHAPKRGKYKESMTAMFNRISAFVKPGKPRTKSETRTTLDSYLTEAKTIGAKTKLKTIRTEKGIKDTVQEFFLEKLFASYKGKHGPKAKQEALDAAVASLPPDITSPVWRLQGLDPHEDTPVEILHVVLLGFVKYFWRDLVQNQINDEQKGLLVVRLNSLNVGGLGISQPAGETLVNYAGSLTGRDFRAIAQVTPFVIYDMVPSDVFDAWVALSTLVPLLWQPIIDDINAYSDTLDAEIKNFLLVTARWTCAWFNKSKFHIILHLPNHIRRFGPAMLFATEAFESFNAVIRAKSIHSNRQAPSRDIAMAFAEGNRIRHLLSGGYFLSTEFHAIWKENPQSLTASDWRTVGAGPAYLIASDITPSSYLGLTTSGKSHAGQCKHDKGDPRRFPQTLTGAKLPGLFHLSLASAQAFYVTNTGVNLLNGDNCLLGQHVIIQPHSRSVGLGQPFIGCVREILQQVGSTNHANSQPDGLLVQTVTHNNTSGRLKMPRLILQDEWSFVPLSDVTCTVNTQHDCYRHKCQTTGARYVYQERIQTEKTRPVVEHLTDPNDLILNTAQMRDAIHVQNFRIPSTPLDEERIIQESVTRAINQRKSATDGASGTGRGRGRGRGARGRGQGRGSNLGVAAQEGSSGHRSAQVPQGHGT